MAGERGGGDGVGGGNGDADPGDQIHRSPGQAVAVDLPPGPGQGTRPQSLVLFRPQRGRVCPGVLGARDRSAARTSNEQLDLGGGRGCGDHRVLAGGRGSSSSDRRSGRGGRRLPGGEVGSATPASSVIAEAGRGIRGAVLGSESHGSSVDRIYQIHDEWKSEGSRPAGQRAGTRPPARRQLLREAARTSSGSLGRARALPGTAALTVQAVCMRSMDSNSARKLPAPKPSSPLR